MVWAKTITPCQLKNVKILVLALPLLSNAIANKVLGAALHCCNYIITLTRQELELSRVKTLALPNAFIINSMGVDTTCNSTCSLQDDFVSVL